MRNRNASTEECSHLWHSAACGVHAECTRCGDVVMQGAHPVVRQAIAEPKDLLAVVKDERGVRWFRWAYDSHTCCPWREMGACAVQIEDEPDHRWSELPLVELVSSGLDR